MTFKCRNDINSEKIVSIDSTIIDIDPNNYRRISLLSIFNRIFERLMYKRLRRNPIEDGAISGFSGQKSVAE